jgi:hypothetical protein
MLQVLSKFDLLSEISFVAVLHNDMKFTLLVKAKSNN